MNALQDTLAQWYETHRRILPWREDPSPYHVWLSEIILQQTRVNQGLDYFIRFTERWPSLPELAQASEEEVLKLWQGLGYYSRARNLHKCARQVLESHGGAFPADYEALRKLQGIGPYTAAAIASIAFGLPHAVVDGNVYRVLSRWYDIDTPINKVEGVRIFDQLADELLDRDHPGRHNQALMEFGALHCVPKRPDCLGCPFQSSCMAFANHTVEERPQKEKKLKTRTRHFNYLVILTPDQGVYLHQRHDKDIWENLYDFPCVESEEALSTEELLRTDAFREMIAGQPFLIQHVSPPFTHKLTHQTIIATFTEIKIYGFLSVIQTKDILLTPKMQMGSFPIPKLIENYLKTKSTWQA